jgi:hypothetical protein
MRGHVPSWSSQAGWSARACLPLCGDGDVSATCSDCTACQALSIGPGASSGGQRGRLVVWWLQYVDSRACTRGAPMPVQGRGVA